MKVLVTGIAGFIGFHAAKKCLEIGCEVVGIDNLNDYYSVSLKVDRLKELGLQPNDSLSTVNERLKFYKIDLSDQQSILRLFKNEKFDYVIHLAAQAGVRYSIENPLSYIKSNAEGFLHILEGCRNFNVKHLIFASSSSVYGSNSKVPFSVEDPVDHPVSLYAATKRANELMAHTYSHLYKVPTTGLRFFTVYGPWGRPDMAPFLFTEAIINDRPIKIFNHGKMERDFTFVQDIVHAMILLLEKIPEGKAGCNKPNLSDAPYRIFNIGSSNPINLMNFIEILEEKIGKKADKIMLPMQDGDVPRTYADVQDLYELVKFRPSVALEDGIASFVDWYKKYYSIT